jgi:hypothetical protein
MGCLGDVKFLMGNKVRRSSVYNQRRLKKNLCKKAKNVVLRLRSSCGKNNLKRRSWIVRKRVCHEGS